MILMSIYALTKRLFWKPFSETLKRATACQDNPANIKHDKGGKKTESDNGRLEKEHAGDISGSRVQMTKNPENNSFSSTLSTPPSPRIGGKDEFGRKARRSRNELLSLTRKGSNCVSVGFLSTQHLKRVVTRIVVVLILCFGVLIVAITTWIVLRQQQVFSGQSNIYKDEDVEHSIDGAASLWTLQDNPPVQDGTSSKPAEISSYQNLEMNLYKNVFNTPGELHLIQVSDDFDDVIVNTAKKLELKGIVFNLKSHQTLQHSIANTILPYYASQKAINSPALQGKYLLSWEQDQISAIFNQMVHQSLMLSQYLSTEGFHILLDAFQHTISEYNSRHHNTETRLHLLIQKPEILMEHHRDNDAETVKQFMRMISSLVEDCQVTVLMMPHKRDFVQWMQTSGDFDSVDASHWFIGEPLYNDTISWLSSMYGSFVTLPQMKTAVQTVGTSRKQINKLLQKVTKGQKFQDAIKTYKEEVMFKFIHELKKMNQPGILLSLFEEFAKPESKRQLYCPQRSPVPAATEYSMEYLEQLEDRGFIYFQSGTSLYGGCGGRVYKPVMKHLIGYQEFISKKMTVLSVQVNNGDRVYPIELQELSVCHMLEKLENHGIDTTRFEYFTVNSRHWYHGNIYRHSDAVLKYLSRNTEVDMKFEETKETEPESQYAKFNGKAGSLEDDGWIGWFTSFVW